MDVVTDQPTVKEMLARMDEGWIAFSDAVHALPSELFEVRLGEGAWSRKQMLAHIAAWHDITTDRLGELAETGEPVAETEGEDLVNARAARGAEGRTSGEIILALDESYRRLRREVARLTNELLAVQDSWAAGVIAGNTYRHHAEHLLDLDRRQA
jgi:uncharacterized damage-inducible protein DinB